MKYSEKEKNNHYYFLHTKHVLIGTFYFIFHNIFFQDSLFYCLYTIWELLKKMVMKTNLKGG